MEADTPDLPSTVEATLAACPKFRIVLIGNSGVGKSSLVSSVFNISLKDIDIAHDRPGDADITRGYSSAENPRLILHDSKGFESGSMANWDIVENFLRERSAMQLQDRVHAIWLCVMTPREGSRLLQTGEEKLLGLAQGLKIPIIVVCTKYDLLINELSISAQEDDIDLSETELEAKAETCFRDRIKGCKELKLASIVNVSTDKDYPRRIETLQELTGITHRCLIPPQVLTSHNLPVDNIEEPVLVPWVITQRINAAQKVELSIMEGFKKYWRNLGQSVFFQGQTLDRCVWRIHDDIVKVWNLNDPQKLLSNGPFVAKIIQLVEPMLCESECQIPQDDFLKKGGDVLTLATTLAMTLAAPFAPYLVAVGIGVLTVRFLYGKYKQLPLTAQYLGAYIVDLTNVLHRLFMKTLHTEPPIPLSEDLISEVVESYKKIDTYRVHRLVREMNYSRHFEDQIAELIREYTIPPQTTHTLQPLYSTSDGDQQPGAQTLNHPSMMTRNSDGPSPFVDRRSGPRSIPLTTASVLAAEPNHPTRHSRRGRLPTSPKKRSDDEGKKCIVM